MKEAFFSLSFLSYQLNNYIISNGDQLEANHEKIRKIYLVN